MRSTVVLTVLLVLVAFAVPHAGRAAAADGSDLLAKHRAFVGWTFGDGTFKSWRMTWTQTVERKPTGDATPPPPRIRTITEVRRGELYRATTTLGENGLTEDEGFTGRVFWDADYNANVVTHYEELVKTDVASNAVTDEQISVLPGVARGSAKIGSTAVDIVRVSPPNGYPVDLYVDADGAYRRVVINPDGLPDDRSTMEVDKYYQAGSKKVLGDFHFGTGTPYVVTSFEANAEVADADLVPPKPRTTWTFGSTDPIPIEVVTHYPALPGEVTSRDVEFKASVNGHVGTFLFDSGASGMLLSGKFADEAELKSIGTTSYSGINGSTQGARNVRIDELAIGSNVLHNVVVQSGTSKGNYGLAGIVGFDILARALVDVDLVKKQMTILDPTKFAPVVGKGAVVFTVDLAERVPRIHVTVSGFDAKPMFDTGDDYFFMLSDRMSGPGKITATVSSQSYFVGVDGVTPIPINCSRLQNVSVGPIRYENGETCFGSARAFGEKGGLIGLDFLRHFNWTFDYPDGKFVLTPNGL
jgi:hypothetical protein